MLISDQAKGFVANSSVNFGINDVCETHSAKNPAIVPNRLLQRIQKSRFGWRKQLATAFVRKRLLNSPPTISDMAVNKEKK
jgi:hypothetical protein